MLYYTSNKRHHRVLTAEPRVLFTIAKFEQRVGQSYSTNSSVDSEEERISSSV